MRRVVAVWVVLLTLALLPAAVASADGGGGFVTGGGWIDSPPGAYYPMDLPLFDGSYYELGTADPPVPWDEAVDLASAMGIEACGSAHLATVTSQGEQDVISGLMAPTTENGWLGGFQPPEEMSLADGWEWITGEPFVYTNWAWGEPNDTPFGTYIAGSEQNLEVYQGSGKWNDAPGWDPWWEPKYHYIVEYEDCYLPAGKAIFSLVAKYKKGASEPTGNVRFRLKAADLDFRSTGLDWLTVADDYAKCLGEGTINGEGGYHFLLWVSDGEPDTFQIGIWHEDGGGVIVYDNGMGQAIGGGNIVVHSA